MAGKAPATTPGPDRPKPSSTEKFSEGYRRAARQDAGRAGSAAAATVDNGAGFLLALVLWGWVALPFLKGGLKDVRNVLRAKFFNKAADGSWLP